MSPTLRAGVCFICLLELRNHTNASRSFVPLHGYPDSFGSFCLRSLGTRGPSGLCLPLSSPFLASPRSDVLAVPEPHRREHPSRRAPFQLFAEITGIIFLLFSPCFLFHPKAINHYCSHRKANPSVLQVPQHRLLRLLGVSPEHPDSPIWGTLLVPACRSASLPICTGEPGTSKTLLGDQKFNHSLAWPQGTKLRAKISDPNQSQGPKAGVMCPGHTKHPSLPGSRGLPLAGDL